MTQTIQEQSEAREQRAKEILKNGTPEALDENTYLVPSQFDSEKRYRVTHFDTYACECEDFQQRCRETGLYCKHIKAILLFQKVKNAYEVEDIGLMTEISQIVEKPTETYCPFCNCQELIKRGVRMTQAGEKQRFRLKQPV